MRYLTLSLLLISNTLFARPIMVVVADLFGSAKFVGEVVITKYDSAGKIYFNSTRFKDTINWASCGWQLKNGFVFDNFDKSDWTCNMPFIGDTVLIVIDGYNRSVVFGKKVGPNYRLWSTLFSESIAIFEFEKPVTALNKEKTLRATDSITTCWDGCLVPIQKLPSLVQEYRNRFSKKLAAVTLEKYKRKEVWNIFYDNTLPYFNHLTWTEGPPGKLKSLVLTYSNKKALEITPVLHKDSPTQLNASLEFDMEEFKKMTIKDIKWLD